MILTLTVNPAIDRTVTTDRINYEDRVYVRSSLEQAGGKGINAARVIHALGARVNDGVGARGPALVTVGCRSGLCVAGMLEFSGFPVSLIPIRKGIRGNLKIRHEEGLAIKLDEAGPQISRAEEQRIEAVTRRK